MIKKNIYYLNNLNKFDNFVRYNALKNEDNSRLTIEILKKDFEKDKISIQQDREIPELFLISKTQKSKILKSKWYQSGKLIFQDKASAAVVKVLDPKPNDYICDMCAAPGNKTSLIAQFSNNQAKIIANEFRKDRSFSTKQLLLELNVSNCHLINTDSINPPIRTTQQFDKILLDAPCTGSGTLLTNPELKWRQNRGFLYQNITLQEKLLHSALKLLKPEGILVYSTCSLYPEEGEQQIIKILEHLIPLDLPEWFSPSYKIKGKEIPGIGRLHPLIHRTQGFFIGKFKKRN
ncbi:MAG: RsmB/NOP family class I SAM-dependent RNA methyltransferase [Candidatus Hermodarchaeota archaeon]